MSVPPGAANLEPCPVATIDVTSLAQMGEPGCNLAGSTLRFPTGEEYELKEPGSGGGIIDSRTPTREVRAANWGIPGVGAVDITDGVVTVWGSTQWAVELQLKLLALEGIESRVS